MKSVHYSGETINCIAEQSTKKHDGTVFMRLLVIPSWAEKTLNRFGDVKVQCIAPPVPANASSYKDWVGLQLISRDCTSWPGTTRAVMFWRLCTDGAGQLAKPARERGDQGLGCSSPEATQIQVLYRCCRSVQTVDMHTWHVQSTECCNHLNSGRDRLHHLLDTMPGVGPSARNDQAHSLQHADILSNGRSVALQTVG